MPKEERAAALPQEDLELDHMRHSCSHILAQAVISMFPDAKLGIGPTIDNGFYYDFDLPRTLIPEDLDLLQEKMIKIVNQRQVFEREEKSADETIEMYRSAGQQYKAEVASDLKEKGETVLSFYVNKLPGTNEIKFIDMCRGGHAENTQKTGAFKLSKIAGAYWKGSEKNPMLQRIYGVCFKTKQELNEYLQRLEEAKKRDHKILGPQLKLFTSSPLVGPGLPLLGPNGATIRRELEEYLWKLHKNKGYMRVYTPHIAKEELYIKSGHAAKFGAELFRVKGKEEDFILKPMNCPHHMQIFADNQFSYRDLPVRYFEPATVYRDEKSGQLGGLTRVRSITQDDGHLFCRVDQIKKEVTTICGIIKEFYTTMGMANDYWVSLSVRGPDREKYLGDDSVWKIAEGALEKAAKANELPYRRVEGEAAFYGPKLDFLFKDCLGREWQLATIQCDFNLPMRFELEYTDEKGDKQRPVVIHRAISGSLERFMGMIIEHFAGSFPTWLAPVQAIVLPISDTHKKYGLALQKKLFKKGVRIEIDDTNETLGKKIRNAEMRKINYMLVVGDKEVEQNQVAARNYKTKQQEVMGARDFEKKILEEIKTRSL
jgi:threonyl-tRNA synthetase